jgi:hypothetical protein
MKKNLFEISEQEKREILERHNALKESPKYKISINNFITEQGGRPERPSEPSRTGGRPQQSDSTTTEQPVNPETPETNDNPTTGSTDNTSVDLNKWAEIAKTKYYQLLAQSKKTGIDILTQGGKFFEKIIDAVTPNSGSTSSSSSGSTSSSTTKPTIIKPDNSVYSKLVFDKPDKFDRRYVYAYLPEQIQENRRRLSEAGRWFAKNIQNNKVFDITDAYPQSVKKLEDWYPQGNVTNPQDDVANPKGDSSNLKGDSTNLKGDLSNLKGDSANLKGDSSNLKGDLANLKGDSKNLKGDSAKTKGDSTNPNSADYYSDYQTDETESETVKKTNYNNATEEDDTTNKSNNYSDYSDVEDDGNSTTANSTKSTKSKTNQPMTFSTYYDEEPVTSKTPPVSGQPLDMELTPQQRAKSYRFN